MFNLAQSFRILVKRYQNLRLSKKLIFWNKKCGYHVYHHLLPVFPFKKVCQIAQSAYPTHPTTNNGEPKLVVNLADQRRNLIDSFHWNTHCGAVPSRPDSTEVGIQMGYHIWWKESLQPPINIVFHRNHHIGPDPFAERSALYWISFERIPSIGLYGDIGETVWTDVYGSGVGTLMVLGECMSGWGIQQSKTAILLFPSSLGQDRFPPVLVRHICWLTAQHSSAAQRGRVLPRWWCDLICALLYDGPLF